MAKALVTGSTGFIGSSLIEELNTLGIEVAALTRSSSSLKNLEGMRFSRVFGDLTDRESLERAVADVDYVFHLAGVITAKNRDGYFRANAEGTRLLADAVAKVRPGLSRFVYVSSLAAGGPSRADFSPRVESEGDAPVSAYGESKLEGEKLLQKFAGVFPVTVVRPPMVYGPRDPATFIFVQTVARNMIPMVSPSGKTDHKRFSVVHVRDLVRGIVQAAMVSLEQVRSGEVFYLTGDDIVTYQELMTTIAEAMEKDPFRFRIPVSALKIGAHALDALGRVTGRTYPLNRDKLNEILPDAWTCSNEKAKLLLGYRPELSFRVGMKNAVDWYKQAGWIK